MGGLPKEKKMKCIVCHGENIQIGTVKEGLNIENDLVYVCVRIPVCRTCGERYYDRQTMRFLEEVNQTLREKKHKNLKEIGKIFEYGSEIQQHESEGLHQGIMAGI